MSISIFYLPHYKDLTHVSRECFMDGRANSCTDEEFKQFIPIWDKLTAGKFPGSLMKLKKRIRDDEYSKYPIIFITSNYFEATEYRKAHGSTSIHVVQRQNQNISHCKSFGHKYISREDGVIILEKTVIHGNCIEPNFKYWFYEKDIRPLLPNDVLSSFSPDNMSGYSFTVEKYKDIPKNIEGKDLNDYENKYEYFSGYLKGEAIEKIVKEYSISDRLNLCFKLIEWDDSWNFVLQDYYGDRMFRVPTKDALAVVDKFVA